jgi:antitoxin component YwqK of YwqJK toxin-antitoxin module
MKNYYSDGSLKSEEMYVNDYKNGKSTYYFPFLRKEKEGNYENCMETGTWTFWDENGKKIAEKEYKNGEIVSEKNF